MKENSLGKEEGALLRSIMAGAIEIIRQNTFTFVAEHKVSYDPNKKDDVVTDADKLAQEYHINRIKECFPGFGVIAEEAELQLPCTIPGRNLYFTIDPIDGTKAFARKQSYGVGTMLSLIENDVVIAVFIGNVTTGEIYGFDPNETDVWRRMYGQLQKLGPTDVPLSGQYILLRKRIEELSEFIQLAVRRPTHGGLFKNYDVEGGSIGLSMARLWKNEVGAMVLEPVYETPWDLCPVIGINQKLNIGHYCLIDGKLTEVPPRIITTITRRNHEVLVTYRNHKDEIELWMKEHYAK